MRSFDIFLPLSIYCDNKQKMEKQKGIREIRKVEAKKRGNAGERRVEIVIFRSLLVGVVAIVAVIVPLVVSPFCCSILFSLASSSTMLTRYGLVQGLSETVAPSG